MELQPLKRIEAQDPKLPILWRQIRNQIIFWSILVVLAVVSTGIFGLALVPMAAAWVVINAVYRLHRHTQVENFMHYRQLEALLSLHALIGIRQPLPPMRLWAISPDFATVLAGMILRNKPGIIVELGSGTSTLISCYCLDKLGAGRVVAFDHAESFAIETRQLLEHHSLLSYAEIIHAPLLDILLPDETTVQWYDTQNMETINEIDLLVVDGPPGETGRMSRYPALPELYDRLSEGAIILVDDYMRSDEYMTVRRWLEQFGLEIVQQIANEKGAIVLRKSEEQKETH